MTCVVGIADGESVWIGADSATADGWTVRECWTPKVFSVGEVLIGYAASWRMGQILRAQLELPEPPLRQKGARETGQELYVTGKLIESIRQTLYRQHWATQKDNRQEGCTLLVGYRGRLFELGDEFQVVEMADQYDAIGCGADFALGALQAIDRMKWSPESRVKTALKAAAYLSGGVLAPFYIMCLQPDGTVGLFP